MVKKEQMIFFLNTIRTRLQGALMRVEEKYKNGEIAEHTRDLLQQKYRSLLARVEGRLVEDEIQGEFEIPIKKIEYRQALYTPDMVFGMILVIIGLVIYIYTTQDMTLMQPQIIELGTNRTGEIWQDYQTSMMFNIASAIMLLIGGIVTINELFGRKK